MTDRINLNEADARTLARLPGIGRMTARRIVAYRDEHGPFTDVQQLTNVRGISKNMVAQFADDVEIVASASVLRDESEQGQEPVETAVSSSNTIPSPTEEQADVPATEPTEQEDISMSENETDAAPQQPEEVVVEPEVIVDTSRENRSRRTENLASTQTAVDQEYERRAVRRGCLTIIFGAVLGGLLGMALTLSVLNALNNNTLQYSDTFIQLRSQLDDEIHAREDTISTMEAQLNEMATQQAEIESTRETALDEMSSLVATSEAGQAALAETAVALETRIGEAGNAADTLDSFLVGLDDLLNELDPGEESSAPEATPTNARTTPEPTADETAVATPTAGPTRTPKPTATPLFPTPTP